MMFANMEVVSSKELKELEQLFLGKYEEGSRRYCWLLRKCLALFDFLKAIFVNTLTKIRHQWQIGAI